MDEVYAGPFVSVSQIVCLPYTVFLQSAVSPLVTIIWRVGTLVYHFTSISFILLCHDVMSLRTIQKGGIWAEYCIPKSIYSRKITFCPFYSDASSPPSASYLATISATCASQISSGVIPAYLAWEAASTSASRLLASGRSCRVLTRKVCLAASSLAVAGGLMLS